MAINDNIIAVAAGTAVIVLRHNPRNRRRTADRLSDYLADTPFPGGPVPTRWTVGPDVDAVGAVLAEAERIAHEYTRGDSAAMTVLDQQSVALARGPDQAQQRGAVADPVVESALDVLSRMRSLALGRRRSPGTRATANKRTALLEGIGRARRGVLDSDLPPEVTDTAGRFLDSAETFARQDPTG